MLRASLWEKEVRIEPYGKIDFAEVFRLASEQSVVGLVAVGLKHAEDAEVPKMDKFQLISETLQLEQQNRSMNAFIAELIQKMRESGIYALLVKGQGVALCYEHPLWRSCGDVDFFLNEENYEKAKAYLTPLAASVEKEYVREKHLGMTIDPWVVELHGRLYSGLSGRIERELDEVSRDTFVNGNVRCWKNGDTEVPLMAVENDAFYVFTHILQHFYKGGIGLRQICDWCRLLYRYREEIDVEKLEGRLHRAGLMTEWKAFGAYAVEYLGMPVESMLMYSPSKKWVRKANRINSFILSVGNMGQIRDSRYMKYPYFIRKCFSAGRRIGDLIHHTMIFPLDSLRFFPWIMWNGVRSAVRGE